MKLKYIILTLAIFTLTAHVAEAKWYNPVSWFSHKVYGGNAKAGTANPGKINQGENPNSPTQQTLKQEKSVSVSTPASENVTVDKAGAVTISAPTNAPPEIVGKDAPLTTVTVTGATDNSQVLGSSFMVQITQAARNGFGLGGLVWVGIGLILFGIFTMTAWGTAIRIGDGKVTPTFLIFAGVGCIVGACTLEATPTWIYGRVFLAVVAYFALHYVFHITSVAQAVTATQSLLAQINAAPVTAAAPAVVTTTTTTAPVAPVAPSAVPAVKLGTILNPSGTVPPAK